MDADPVRIAELIDLARSGGVARLTVGDVVIEMWPVPPAAVAPVAVHGTGTPADGMMSAHPALRGTSFAKAPGGGS